MEQNIPYHVQEQVPPPVPNDPPIGNAIFKEFRACITWLAQDLKEKANRGEVDPANRIGERVLLE